VQLIALSNVTASMGATSFQVFVIESLRAGPEGAVNRAQYASGGSRRGCQQVFFV
jgi:hypothetical protein